MKISLPRNKINLKNGWSALVRIGYHAFFARTADDYRAWRINLNEWQKSPQKSEPELFFRSNGDLEVCSLLPSDKAEAIVVYAGNVTTWDEYPVLLTIDEQPELGMPAVPANQALPDDVLQSIATFCLWEDDEPIFAYCLVVKNNKHYPLIYEE